MSTIILAAVLLVNYSAFGRDAEVTRLQHLEPFAPQLFGEAQQASYAVGPTGGSGAFMISHAVQRI
jgi:hypothetical protein